MIPVELKHSYHTDARGEHRKFFGNIGESLEYINDFTPHEVFMTTNNRNTVRGIHIQTVNPQAKIVKAVSGRAIANAACLDVNSNLYGSTILFILDSQNQNEFYIPKGWGLGYRALEDDTRILYIADEDFHATSDLGINPLSPDFFWGDDAVQADLIVSERDLALPTLAELVAQQ